MPFGCSPGSVGGEFQSALERRGIRCTTGDSANLFATEEITTLISILQIIYNPLQDIPLASVLTSPVFGFTAQDLALLRSNDHFSSLYDLMKNSTDEKPVKFFTVLTALRQQARLSSVTQLLAEVFRRTNILSIYAAMPNGGERLENLQTFYQMASDYEVSGQKELGRFLDFLVAAQERGFSRTGSQQEKGAVTLMSIHKSKGLEFPIVFLCGLSRSFNQESIRQQVLCDQELGLGLNCVNAELRIRYPSIAKRAISRKMQQQSISEELRVLYVAMTRARDRLIMTYASKYLQSDIQDIGMRLKFSNRELMASEVDCPGSWVLQAAMVRTEAAELFAIGSNPGCAQVSDIPWKISVVSGHQSEENAVETIYRQTEISDKLLNILSDSISFAYPHTNATQIPSKLTATQLKGRWKDTEISEGTDSRVVPNFRKPGVRIVGRRGREYGNAIHAVLQHIHFSNCTTLQGVQAEVKRLTEERLISPEQGQLVDCEKIARFFRTDLGRKLCECSNVLREFKFSILDDAKSYYTDAESEQILLQGVVDCAIVEDDHIVVIDFKTDFVTEDTVAAISEGYRPQVSAYVRAMERIYQRPVTDAVLYFFELDRIIQL